MARFARVLRLTPLLLAVTITSAFAQPLDTLGARAQGMAGAFVAIADDASAAAWNPAGLAHGSFFNLLIERGGRRRSPDRIDADRRALDQTSAGFAIATLPLGVSYYRHRSTIVRAATETSDRETLVGDLRMSSLVTHQTGVTLLHSLTPGIAVGGTLKLVRGIAATAALEADTTSDALDRAADTIGRASNTFDADLGVLVVQGPLRAGFAVRNVVEPTFAAPSGEELSLARHARAGLGWVLRDATTLSLDADLTRPAADRRRRLALGVEHRWRSQVAVRGGVRVHAEGDRGAALALGGSVAVRPAIWVDGFWTGGPDEDRSWGLAGRIAY
jgi:hypothetical protein